MTEEIPRVALDTWPVADLDWWFDTQGRGDEWRGSTQRAAKLMAERREAR